MTQALVTIVAPLPLDRIEETSRVIEVLGNPAGADIVALLEQQSGEDAIHFMSLQAVRSCDGLRGWLALELSADGAEKQALDRLVSILGERLRPIFARASDWTPDRDFAAYLWRHRARLQPGWLGDLGAAFPGTPGLTVGRIRREAALASHLSTLMGATHDRLRPLDRLDRIRQALAADPIWEAELQPSPAIPEWRHNPWTTARLIASFAATFLWPLGILVLAWTAIDGIWFAGVWHGLWLSILVALLLFVVAALAGYLLLIAAEKNDWLDERSADRATLAEMFARENRCAQNHMLSVTQRKPGLLRSVTSRLVFWAVGALVTYSYRPGFLSDIGTIHFARWVTPRGSPDVFFFSNFDASWESYLEDFITRAHAGLTAVWSNSIGFPRTSGLIGGGATDGERFKRYARHSMQPTQFWYSAYPTLTTNQIRINTEIRSGLSGAITEDDAARWLALFGSAARPPDALVSNEIQSLVFGGLKFLRHATCLIATLPHEPSEARAWLTSVRHHIAYGDGRRFEVDPAREAVLVLAVGASGLAKLGLPSDSLATFPFAFLEGMATEARTRILGDFGPSAPGEWLWGGAPPDAALLLFGRNEDAVTALREDLAQAGAGRSMPEPFEIPLRPIDGHDKREPFGFADGISQPVIRGTYKGLRNADAINLVEAGEFVLGYPDNRGNRPPGPTLSALHDPANRLPLVDAPQDFSRTTVEGARDLGRNGSFLVIRQLEQDVDGFQAYCDTEAARLRDSLGPPYEVTPEFVGAKMVGRWQDGSSLVRHPYASRSGSSQARHGNAGRAETSRPTTHPEHGQGIERSPPREPHVAGDNDFLFGAEDAEALRCPFGAHVRRSNPRDSLDPGSDEQVAITNRHRILRVGRQFQPEAGGRPGLLFMCLNGDIERQFEFVQQSWLRNPGFHGLSCEKDPLLGDGEQGACGFTIPSRSGPIKLAAMPQFVTTRGGGYFFLPGERLVDFLCSR